MPTLPLQIEVKDPKSALAAVMHMTLKHTADVLTAAVCAIAEKYGIDEEEMMEVVRSHPRFTEMTVEPMIHELMPSVAEEPVVPAPAKKRGPKKLSEMTAEERAAYEAKAAERKAAKVAVVAIAAPPAPVAEPAAEPAVEPAPVRKTFKIKPKITQPTAPDS
jgi:hypothetical protein